MTNTTHERVSISDKEIGFINDFIDAADNLRQKLCADSFREISWPEAILVDILDGVAHYDRANFETFSRDFYNGLAEVSLEVMAEDYDRNHSDIFHQKLFDQWQRRNFPVPQMYSASKILQEFYVHHYPLVNSNRTSFYVRCSQAIVDLIAGNMESCRFYNRWAIDTAKAA